MKKKLCELKSKVDAIEGRKKARKEVDAREREKEVEFLHYQKKLLDKFLHEVREKVKS